MDSKIYLPESIQQREGRKWIYTAFVSSVIGATGLIIGEYENRNIALITGLSLVVPLGIASAYCAIKKNSLERSNQQYDLIFLDVRKN